MAGGGGPARGRIEHIIPSEALDRGTYSLYIEVSCNGLFGAGPAQNDAVLQPPDVRGSACAALLPLTAQMVQTYLLRCADLVIPDVEVRGLAQDFEILRQVAKSKHNPISSLPQRALRACDEIMDTFRRPIAGQDDPSLLHALLSKCRSIAHEVLGEVDSPIPPVSEAVSATQPKIWAIGHW